MNQSLINLIKYIYDTIGIEISINDLIKLLDIYIRTIDSMKNDSDIRNESLYYTFELVPTISTTDLNYGGKKSIKEFVKVVNDLVMNEKIDENIMPDILENIIEIFADINLFIQTSMGYLETFIKTQISNVDKSKAKNKNYSKCKMTFAAIIDDEVKFNIYGYLDKETKTIKYELMSIISDKDALKTPYIL